METQNTLDSQELPKQLSDAAWNSILPFLRDCRVYVGNPETCRHFLSAVLWIAKEGRRGAPYRKSMVIGTRSIVALVDGARHSMNIFMMRATSHILIDSNRAGTCLGSGGSKKKGGQEAQALGRTRGGFTTKLNLSLSDACVPLRFILIEGHRNDITASFCAP